MSLKEIFMVNDVCVKLALPLGGNSLNIESSEFISNSSTVLYIELIN